MQNRLSLFTKFYTHHTRFLFVPNPNVVRSLVERRSTPRPQIWPTQKFWCGAPMLTIRFYLHSFSRYCLRNTRNVAKFEENLTLQQFKVIQKSSILVSMESPMWLHISHFVTLAVSATIFEIFTHEDRKLLILLTLPCLTSPSGGTPCDINVIYTPLQSTLNGLQLRR